MWDCVLLVLEKGGAICQVSLSPCVKLVLVNYQVQLDSGMNPPLVFTVIHINAVIPNAFKTREVLHWRLDSSFTHRTSTADFFLPHDSG